MQQTPLQVRSCTPISRSKFKTRSAHADSPISKLKVFISNKFYVGPVFASQFQETQGENLFGAIDSFVGPLLCTYLLFKVRDPFSTCRQSSNTFLNLKTFISKNFHVGPVFASQFKKLRENLFGTTDSITGPLLYTYLLFKVQDPFSACRQSNF